MEVEEAILRRLLEGATYREIQREFGVSLATINRIVEDARKRLPDVDTLMKLSRLLRKSGSNIFDATRGARLQEKLNLFDVTPDELEHYLKLTERSFSDEVLDNKILEAAIKLMRLEEKCEKPYEAILRDFEFMLSEATRLKAEKKVLEEKKRTLKKDLEKAEKDRDILNSEVERATATHKRLRKIGIEKIDTLAKFVEEFEALGYDAIEAKEFAELKDGLMKIDVDPKRLGEYIEQKTSLNADIYNLTIKKAGLQNEVNRMMESRRLLLARNSLLLRVSEILTTRRVLIPCKVCGFPSRIPLDACIPEPVPSQRNNSPGRMADCSTKLRLCNTNRAAREHMKCARMIFTFSFCVVFFCQA